MSGECHGLALWTGTERGLLYRYREEPPWNRHSHFPSPTWLPGRGSVARTALSPTRPFGRTGRAGASCRGPPRLPACSSGDRPGHAADDRRPARRESHDRVQCVLASRPAVRRAASPGAVGGAGARLRRARPHSAGAGSWDHGRGRRPAHRCALLRLQRRGLDDLPWRPRRHAGPHRVGGDAADVERPG